MQSIASSPIDNQSSRPDLRLVARDGTATVRDEDSAPYDGQTKAERDGTVHVTTVRDDVLDEIAATLGLGALGLYTYLERRANKRGRCALSYSRIADDTKASRRHIIDLMKVLVDAGYVRITTPPDAQRTHTPNTFTLLLHPQQKLVQDLHQAGERASERAGANPAPKVVSKYSPSTAPPLPPKQGPPPLDAASNERFQTFRSAYPAKRRSGNARELAREWASLTKSEQEAAIASLAVFVVSAEWQESDGRYIPSILRFVTEHRWESVPAPEPPSLRPTDYGFYGSTGLEQFRAAVRRGEIAGVTPAMVEAGS